MNPRRRSFALGAVVMSLALGLTGCSASTPTRSGSATPTSGTPTSSSAPTASTPATPTSFATTATSTGPPSTRTRPVPDAGSRPSMRVRRNASATPAPRPSDRSGGRLPLSLTTGSATQVVTVTAASTASTQATLQAWTRSSGGWRRHGPAVAAWLGSDGLGHANESRSATPVGSFTLTQAFGRNADPGARLPYTQTTPADWWVSQSGPLYNTRQRCSSGCGFTTGDPNEHLYYTTPFYDYAVVIDYNTRNAPGGVHQGRGSAFFLHVTVGEPTQGCVSIARDRLVDLLRWLRPSARPRMLIGVG